MPNFQYGRCLPLATANFPSSSVLNSHAERGPGEDGLVQAMDSNKPESALPGEVLLTTLEYWAELQPAPCLWLESCSGFIQLPAARGVQSLAVKARRHGALASELSLEARVIEGRVEIGHLSIVTRTEQHLDAVTDGEPIVHRSRAATLLPGWFQDNFPQLANRMAPGQAIALLMEADRINELNDSAPRRRVVDVAWQD